MPRKKGTPKTGGRQKGSLNKVTRSTKQFISEIIGNNLDKAQQMLDLIVEPKDWLYHFEKLLEYEMPKKASVQVSADEKTSDFASELKELTEKEI